MKQIIFWKYDLFPYTLYGVGEQSVSYPGSYYVPSYGRDFRPFLILPEIEANDLIAQLEDLKRWKKEEEDKLNELFDQRLKSVVKNHPKFKK
jgi:hypothetical protein